MEPIFSGELFQHWYQSIVAWLLAEVLTPANVVYIAMQIPAAVSAGFGAWWVHDFVHPQLTARIQRLALSDRGKTTLLTLATLLFPLLWVVGLALAGAVAVHFAWPHDLIRLAIHLLVAWIGIQFAALLVRDPTWSRALVMVAYAVAVLHILNLLEPALAFLDRLAINFGSLRISFLTILEWMLSFGVLLWVAMLVSEMLERRIRRLPNLTPSVQVLIGKLFKASMITLAVVVSLTSTGIDFTALALFSGALGVGLGFGLQHVASNLLSGVVLLMDKSIKPGDIIQIGNTYGWVASLGARYVSVETRDGTEYLIPNEDIITHQVVNWSHRNDLARLKVQVRISYDADVHQALALMVQAAGKPGRVLREPAPRALLLGFEENGLELELRFWIRDVQNGIRNVSSDVMLEIWRLFCEHGIQIPMPRREIHWHPAVAGTLQPEVTPSELAEPTVAFPPTVPGGREPGLRRTG